jgi:dTDP-4-amino-4,6-dideoxygalactose transaminase
MSTLLRTSAPVVVQPPLRVPFNRPPRVGGELEAIAQALDAGKLSGDNAFTKKCHAALEAALGVPRVLLTTSCTDALEMAAILLDIRPGDEVIFPSYTFVSTVNAFVLRGCTPVFADVREDTINLDESKLEPLITPRTRAIVPVHYAGVACEMDAIGAIAARRRIPIVEDNAHGLFGTYRGRALGTFGVLATQSFHETKNFTCGEGGALIINDAALAQRAEIIREKGTDRSRFFRGEVDKYGWVDVGSSFLPSDLLAAHLLVQLEARERIQSRRREIWERYERELGSWAKGVGARPPVVPDHCGQAYHMYYLLMPDLASRSAFIAHLKARGVLAVFHYLPLHLSAMGLRFGGRVGDCPVTERVSDRLVRLPMYYNMTDEEQSIVLDAVRSFPS